MLDLSCQLHVQISFLGFKVLHFLIKTASQTVILLNKFLVSLANFIDLHRQGILVLLNDGQHVVLIIVSRLLGCFEATFKCRLVAGKLINFTGHFVIAL